MKTILLFSGGLDSTTLLYKLKDEHEVICLCVDYGQRHRRELLAAKAIAKEVGVKCHKVRLPEIWRDCSLVGGKPLPDGDQPGNIVPNRNMVMLSIATTYAIEQGAEVVAWGPNRDDWGTFPDCGEQFAESMRDAMMLCHTRPIALLTPLINLTKAEVVALAIDELGVPTGATWSCYEGGREPCRKCGACISRIEAFRLHFKPKDQKRIDASENSG